ncbi:hypothetical protein EG830_14000 [bacterium]|nr:hypothetical protein [bacterium]
MKTRHKAKGKRQEAVGSSVDNNIRYFRLLPIAYCLLPIASFLPTGTANCRLSVAVYLTPNL